MPPRAARPWWAVPFLVALHVAAARSAPAQGAPAGPAAAMRLVATRRLARGTVLGAADIGLAPGPAAGRGRDTAAVVPGWIARRVIQPGEPLVPPAVGPAPLVRAGGPVEFTLHHDGLTLALAGTAPVSAGLGDTIAVRVGAKRQFMGVVTGPGRVEATERLRTR